jgi:hypothetical protein
MPATPIEFPTSSLHFFLPGHPPTESQGRLLNVYLEQEKEQGIYKRVPGTQLFTDVGADFPRGFIESDGFVYGAYEDCVKRIDSAGNVTTLSGALPGIDRVTWAKNNQQATPPRGLVVVSELGAYSVTPTTVAAYPDGDLAGSPTSVCHLDGYILFTYGNGRIVATGLNDLAVDPLSMTTAEANPDGLLRGIVSGRQLFAMGSASIEVYQNVGSSPFPLARAAVIPVGLIGTFAAAGGNETDGWDQTPLFVASDGTVRHFKGYEPVIVSTRAVEHFIASIEDKSTLTAYVYTFFGNSIWGLRANGTTPQERCWEYNTSTGNWHERQSQGFLTWRGHRTILAFDKWLVGDVATTQLRAIEADVHTEHFEQIPCRIESKVMRNFPERIAVSRADFSFAPGVGIATGRDPIQTDPVTEISWSDDGGATWSRPLRRTLGRQGMYGWDVRVNRTGLTTKAGRRWRVDFADPVPVAFFGATMDVEARQT